MSFGSIAALSGGLPDGPGVITALRDPRRRDARQAADRR